MILMALASLTATAQPQPTAPRIGRMTALYDQVCLKLFPDDAAVAAVAQASQARELTPAEVKITMRDDPARGWELPEGHASLWIEFPPFHACSVRWSDTAIGDLGAYRALADAYERKVGGFESFTPMEADQGDIHIRMTGERRVLADGRAESLMFVEQHIINAARRAAGETGFTLRFVHQFAPPEQ